MAQAVIPVRLLSRRNFDKSDVESIYAQFVQVIGGTYYVNGVSTGPVSGTLDWRNFSKNAGIPNVLKSSPLALNLIQFKDPGLFVPINGTNTYYAALPAGLQLPATIVGWNAAFGWTMAASTTVSAFVVRNGVATAVGTSAVQATYTKLTVFANQTGLSVPMVNKDVLKLTITSTAGPTGSVSGEGFVAIWYKSPHLK